MADKIDKKCIAVSRKMKSSYVIYMNCVFRISMEYVFFIMQCCVFCVRACEKIFSLFTFSGRGAWKRTAVKLRPQAPASA